MHTIEIVSFKIPDQEEFPDQFKNGTVKVGVYPPVGLMRPVLSQEGGMDRLREWSINNILLGLIEGDYTESELIEEETFFRVLNQEGEIIFDTFVRIYERIPQGKVRFSELLEGIM